MAELGLSTQGWEDSFARRGFDYTWQVPGHPLIFRTLDINHRFGQVRAHIAIDTSDETDAQKRYRLYADTLNVRDGQARRRFAETVDRQSGRTYQHFALKLDWFCAKVDAAERHQGGDPEIVTGEPQAIMAQHLVDPILVDGKATWFLAPGGTGKSWIGALVCVCMAAGVPLAGMEVHKAAALYLDWEDDQGVFKERLYMLARGLAIPNQSVHYRQMVGPLRNYLRPLAAYIQRHGIKLVVVDSVGMAMSGYEGGFEDVALALHADLRALGCSVMALDHVSGEDVSQGNLANKAYGCFSADTEVLTRSGWKLHPDLVDGEEVLAYDKDTDAYRWEVPSHRWEYDYTGPMYHLATKQVEALVTPTHRMMVRRRLRSGRSSVYQSVEAEQLGLGEWYMPVAGDGPDGPDVEWFEIVSGYRFSMDTWLRFLGWMISDGSTQRGRMRLAQVLGVVESAMVETVRDLGFSYWRQERVSADHQTLGQIVINGTPDLTRWYEEQTGLRSGDKHLPDFVWSLSIRQKRVLLRALLDGDGSTTRSGLPQYTTKSKQLADDVQRLAILTGRHSTIRRYTTLYRGQPYTYYRVSIFHAERRETMYVAKTAVSTEHYEGKVYCLTVPSDAYLVRYNGYSGIYGNSIYKMNLARLAWSLRAEEPYGSKLRVGLFNVKANWGKRRPPIGLEFDFSNQEEVRVKKFDVRDSPELSLALPLRERIAGALHHGSMEIKDIAEMTGIKEGRVKAILINGRRHGIFTTLSDGTWGNTQPVTADRDAPVPW